MKKLTLALLGLIISIVAVSQENYLAGYIIRNAKDTVRGYIDYRNWKTNPASIHFKREMTAETMIYPPTHIAAFSVGDELYEAAEVDIEVSPDKVNELSYEFEFKIEKQIAFLQCLIQGDKSLFYLVNKVGKDNFYIKQESGFELLLYKQYARSVNSARQVLQNNKFTGQLAVYLNDCSIKTGTSRYLKKDLSKLFEAYYECKGINPAFSKKVDKIKIEFGALTGILISSFDIESNTANAVSEADYEPSINLTGGVFLTLVLPRNQGRFAIQNELLLTSYNIKGHHLQYASEDNYTETAITVKATHLKLNTLARMKIPIQQVNLRLEAGMSNAYALSISADQVKTRVFYAPAETETSSAMNERKYEQGLVGGVGLDYNQFSLTARYERGNGLSQAVSVKTSFDRIFFMVGYQIGK
jgi:hypothetical protein